MRYFGYAMEADDITKEVEDNTKEVDGEDTNDPVDEPSEEDDPSKTEDIFGDEDDGGETDETTEETEDDEQDENPPDESIGDDSGEDLTSDTEEVPTDNSDTDSDGNTSNIDDIGFADVNTIRDNLVYLYNTITNDIEILTNASTAINSVENLDVVNIVLERLRSCKSNLFKIITKEVGTVEYPELVRKYIIIKEVYYICVQMIEKYFEGLKTGK